MALSKKKTTQLVMSFSPYFIKTLKLRKQDVRFYVIKSSSHSDPKDRAHELRGLCEPLKGRGRIWIYYDNIVNQKDCLITILHELLHLKFHCLRKSKQREEKIIQFVEKLYLDSLQNKILGLYLK